MGWSIVVVARGSALRSAAGDVDDKPLTEAARCATHRSRIVLCWLPAGSSVSSPLPLGPVEAPPSRCSDGPAQRPLAQPPARIDAKQPGAILFKNVKVFDGKSDKLTASTSVLVVGNKIEKIGGDIAAPEKATVIDAGGRTLMPGLIDAHWHAMLVRPTPAEALTWDIGYANLVAGAEATDTLLRGFTTVRDVGGPAFGLKRAIDEGVVAGPRIYPSGAIITVTSGHGDFRQPFEVPRTLGGAADAHGTDRRRHGRRQSG